MSAAENVKNIAKLMQERNITAYIIPTDDFHSSEYVGEYFKARKFVSGFTGSAGTLCIVNENAYLFTDGRYFLQASKQLEGSNIELMKMGEEGVPEIVDFIADSINEGDTIGFDGRCINLSFFNKLKKACESKAPVFKMDEDLVDLIWEDRPSISKEEVWELGIEYAGRSRADKMADVREKIKEAGAKGLFISSLDEIAWLLNLRGNDIAYTPVFLSYMLLLEEKAYLFLHDEILSDEIKEALLKDGIEIRPYDAIYSFDFDGCKGDRILVDISTCNVRLYELLNENTKVIEASSPIILMKAVKNAVEVENMRKAHIKDGIAMVRFIYWLKTHAGRGITELSADKELKRFRSEMEGFKDYSFGSIIAYGPHGAIIHYGATEETDAKIEAKGLCLLDTGSHFLEGSTDITRTVVLGELTPEEKKAYTLVLKGNLNLGAAKFKKGISGAALDVLARTPLWMEGLDYNHGTGHGVGYLLSVHEGPQRILHKAPHVPLEPGMITSNEPGYYKNGEFGIRLENLVLTVEDKKTPDGTFLKFETLTLVPFDRAAIDIDLLTDEELSLLNSYHEKVRDTLRHFLFPHEYEWLEEQTKELSR